MSITIEGVEYVTLEDYRRLLERIAQLERANDTLRGQVRGLREKVAEQANLPPTTGSWIPRSRL